MKAKLLLLLLVTFAILCAATGTPIGRVTRVLPRADLLRGKFGGVLKENADVIENDRIQTQSLGRARVVLNDGSILNVGSDSSLTVRGTSQNMRAGSFELRYGRIRAVVAAQTGASVFQVRTATAVAGVLGTTVYVEMEGQSTHVVNLSDEGSGSRVRVNNVNPRIRGEVILEPGEGTMVLPGQPPQPPHSMGAVITNGFVAQTEVPN